MPWLTFGKYQTRDELEQNVLRLYRQGETSRHIGYKCGISGRSVQRILAKHGVTAEDRSPGIRPAGPRSRPGQLPDEIYLVRSPCWRSYCDDPRCIYHQEASHVRQTSTLP